MNKIMGLPVFLIPYLIPAISITLLVRMFAHKYNKLHLWEYISIFLPWIIWIILGLLSGRGKTLVNGVVEPFIIGLVFGLLQIVRAYYPEKVIIFSLIIPICSAVLVWLLMPGLPE